MFSKHLELLAVSTCSTEASEQTENLTLFARFPSFTDWYMRNLPPLLGEGLQGLSVTGS